MLDISLDSKIRSRYLPAAAALAILVLTVALLPAVNISWDEALGDFFFGERNLSYLTSFDDQYLDFESDPYPAGRVPDLSGSAFRNRPWEHPPAASTLAAASSSLLSRGLGLLDPFDGYHAVNAFLAALLCFQLWRSLQGRHGLIVAALSVGFLFTLPRVFAHLLANIKDFPSMVLFSLALLIFVSGFERGSTSRIVLAGVVWGVALATRPTALFLPIIPLGVVLFAATPKVWQGRKARLLRALLGAGAAGGVTLLACWPYLWAAPFNRYLQHIRFLTERHETTSELSRAPVLDALLLTTPPLVMVLFLVGLVPLVQRMRRREPMAILLGLWLLNAPMRYLLPGALNYDGVRHFLDIFPPIAVVAALGAALAIRQISSQFQQRQMATVLLLLALLTPGACLIASTHPFQIAYWNTFAGGPYGAWEDERPQSGDYWGLSYREGLRWLNDNAPEGSAIAVPVVEHSVRMVAPQRLREDLGLLALTTPYSPELRPQWRQILREVSDSTPLFVMMVPRRDWTNELMAESYANLEPVAEWRLGGAPILLIYRW